MKKLENKVFYILIIILFTFLITILFIFNVQSYSREKNNIENNLMRMSNSSKGGRKDKEIRNNKNFDVPVNLEEDIKHENEQKVFMDSNIYTVLINSNKEIDEIISHTEDRNVSEEIKEVAKKIISVDNLNKITIGNLYFENYSYSFKNSNELIIEDNSMSQIRLKKELKTSCIIFIIMGCIIIYVSKKLTTWITKPAIDALNKQKQFIADASHELKTPIAVIMASSEALETDFKQKWIDNIKSESERMNKLIMNLLNLSKIENTVDKELYLVNNLSKIIENSSMTFESLIYEKNVKLITDIENNIYFKCDMYQIKQLVGILVDNAIKHSESNGEITIKLKTLKNDTIFEVTNIGKTIPKDIQDKIFERFYRSDESRNRDENRYGLGLAIAKSIVTNHDGKISVNSDNGRTTFKVIFKKLQK